MNAAAINARLDSVQALYEQNIQRAEIIEALSRVFDIERLMTRTVYGSATPKEIYSLASTCDQLPALKALAEGCGCPELTALAGRIDPLEDIKGADLRRGGRRGPLHPEGGRVIRAGYNAEVDELRDIVHGGKGYLSHLEAK